MKETLVDDPYSRLADAVKEAKGGQPLRRVTVVTSSLAVSRDVLRYLACSGGLANTSVLTTSQLVEQLARAQLLPRTPLPYPLLVGSVRRVLAESPGRFEEVADQSITARAVASASQWLAAHPPRSAADPGQVVSEVLRIHADATGRNRALHFLRHEQLAAAESQLSTLGAVIVFLPCEQDPATASFLAKVAQRAETVDAHEVATGTLVLHASDADDEIRNVVRLVRDRLAAGTPGHRIGLFYGSESPYLATILTHLRAAEIAFSGPDARSLGDGAAARSLLRILRMKPDDIQRRELLAILAERAVRWTGGAQETGRLSLRQAEILTRGDVAVVGGADWEALREVAVDERGYDTAQSLLSLVESLRASLSEVAAVQTWEDAADAVTGVLAKYFVGGDPQRRSPKGPSSAAEGDCVELAAIAAELRQLSGVGPAPSVPVIIDALEVGIGAVRRRIGEMGAGVTVGPIGEGSGRDLDISIIVGMAEGIVPQMRRDDPLLPESITGVSQVESLDLQHRALELAIGSGRTERVLSFPRGSLRGGAEKVPSRWLLPTLRALAGDHVTETNWLRATAGCDRVVVAESFDTGMRKPDERIGLAPATATEWRVRTEALAADSTSQLIRVARQLRADRRRGRFTRFTGNLADAAGWITILDGPIAPTRLEEWVASPYLFFIQRILGVSPLEDPDEDTQIDPLRRGNLVHEILEDYVNEVIAGHDGGLERLRAIGQEHLHSATTKAPGWLPQVWARDAGMIRADLDTWHQHDASDRALGWNPIAAETSFGAEDDEGNTGTVVALDLDLGTMQFRGKVDRIDRHADGRVRITDYKTGSSRYSANLVEADPTAGTTKFQLPVYGLLGRLLAGEAPVTARYWFATSKGDFAAIGYPITDHVIDVLRRDLSFCQRSIRAGMFPPKLGSLGVRELGQLLGAAELERTWHALRDEPALADFVAIYEGEGLQA